MEKTALATPQALSTTAAVPAEDAASPTSHLDLGLLREIAGGSPEVLRAIADEYAVMAAEVMSSLDLALASGDRAEIQRKAHTLKGSSGMVGALGVMRAAAAIEHAAAAGDLEAARRGLPALIASQIATLAQLAAAK